VQVVRVLAIEDQEIQELTRHLIQRLLLVVVQAAALLLVVEAVALAVVALRIALHMAQEVEHQGKVIMVVLRTQAAQLIKEQVAVLVVRVQLEARQIQAQAVMVVAAETSLHFLTHQLFLAAAVVVAETKQHRKAQAVQAVALKVNLIPLALQELTELAAVQVVLLKALQVKVEMARSI
jgi:hypothetical protein